MLNEMLHTAHGRTWAALMIAFAGMVLLVQTSCGMTCEERSGYAEEYIDRVVASNQRCNWDDDCLTMTIITQCGNMCARAVNVEGVDAVDQAVAYVDDVWCGDGQALGCGYLTPTCDMPGIAYCDQGTCRND